METEQITALEAAIRLGVRLNYVYMLLRERRIEACLENGEWRVDAASVKAYKRGSKRLGQRV